MQKVRRKLEELQRHMKNVKWKMNVNIPQEWFIHTDFDKISILIENELNRFHQVYKRFIPTEPEQIWHKFTSNVGVQHEFKILDFHIDRADWRDAVSNYKSVAPENKHEFTAVKVVMYLETTINGRAWMLLTNPLEFSLTGKATRMKKTGEIQSVEFTALIVSDGTLSKKLMEIK